MTDSLNNYLSSVEEREKKASAGPWYHDLNGFIAPIESSEWGDTVAMTGPSHTEQDCLNADFIAHSRTTIPLQTAIIRKMAEALDEIKIKLRAAGFYYESAHIETINTEIEALITQATKP